MDSTRTHTLTLAGPDRTGIIAAVCDALDTLGATITEARLGRLQGRVSGVVVIEVPVRTESGLRSALAPLRDSGIHCETHPVESPPGRASRPFIVTYRGGDRPGMLHALSHVLKVEGCEFTSVRVDAVKEAGLTDYVLACDIEAPMRVTRQALEAVVDAVSHDFGVSLVVMPADLDDLLP